MTTAIPTINAEQLKAMLEDGAELALIDVREQDPFSREHLLFACCIPLSRMELIIDDLVPRRSVRTLVMDGGDANEDRAARAAERLAALGYSDLAILQGGLDAWRKAGFEVFSGVNVPSKAFGEIVEQTCHTPHITPEALKARLDSGEKLVILDARPQSEYQRMNIPGGIDTPGAELVYRVRDLVPDANTPVIVNCAGRTRSIIGTQSLINAGLPNPVAALKGGTMGWRLAGFELEHDQQRFAAAPSPDAVAWARRAAQRVGERAGVRRIDAEKLQSWRESDARSLFIFDVRSPEEFDSGHLADARSAPGGQLIQATDEYVGIRNCRIVLVDDTEVRATMTASWLLQLGWPEVYVLAGGLDDLPLVNGKRATRVPGLCADLAFITPEQLQARLRDGATAVVDLASSVSHRAGHVPGAWWTVRARLAQALPALASFSLVVLTCEDGILAQLAAPELSALRPDLDVKVISGGNQAWQDAGLGLETGMTKVIGEIDDVWYKPYEHPEADPQAMQGYLTWEVDLVPQIYRDGIARFRPLASEG